MGRIIDVVNHSDLEQTDPLALAAVLALALVLVLVLAAVLAMVYR